MGCRVQRLGHCVGVEGRSTCSSPIFSVLVIGLLWCRAAFSADMGVYGVWWGLVAGLFIGRGFVDHAISNDWAVESARKRLRALGAMQGIQLVQ